jgi:ankyrin repeat protein
MQNLEGPFDQESLFFASKTGNTETITQLVREQHVDVDLRSGDDSTALHIATLAGKEEVVRLLLEYGANPNSMNHKRLTALHIAAKTGNDVIATLLLGALADPKCRDTTVLLLSNRQNVSFFFSSNPSPLCSAQSEPYNYAVSL